jgi:YfiR/HmsC-like
VAPVASILAALALLAGALPALAQDSAVTEDSVKAAFLYKFPGFIEWPANVLANPEEPVVIGVAGASDVLLELRNIAESRKPGRPLVAKAVRDAASLAGVHVLFIGTRERARAPVFIRAAQQAGALVVTEWSGALNTGSIINFVVTADGRVRFEISLEPAEKSGLRLSSRLLSVAQQVLPARP